METCFNYCYEVRHNDNTGYFSSDEKRWITRIHKLAKKYPDVVTILKEPEENNGCIYARLPSDWLKFAPKKALSETQLKVAREHIKKVNEARNKAID